MWKRKRLKKIFEIWKRKRKLLKKNFMFLKWKWKLWKIFHSNGSGSGSFEIFFHKIEAEAEAPSKFTASKTLVLRHPISYLSSNRFTFLRAGMLTCLLNFPTGLVKDSLLGAAFRSTGVHSPSHVWPRVGQTQGTAGKAVGTRKMTIVKPAIAHPLTKKFRHAIYDAE